MKTFLRHLKQFGIILIICFILVAIINYNLNETYDEYILLRLFAVVFSYTLSIYVANALVLSDFYLKREKNLKNIIIGGLLVNLLTVTVVFLINIIGNLFYTDFQIIESFKLSLKTAVFSSWFSMTISTTVYVALLIRRKDKIEVTQQKDIAVKATASFETLKNQLDPHFLFNSLNVLSSLIEENPLKAQEFTVALSKIYRYVLDQKDKNLISVEEELNFAKLYISLLKMRFENGISVNFLIDESVFDYKIVPLSLQLLLENAIKHNSISDKKPLLIKIYQEENYLVVQNSLQKKQTFEKSSGIGLSNIIYRYELVSNTNVEIMQTNDLYKVKLPLISSDSLFDFQQDNITETLFENAYSRMKKLKEFYQSLFLTIVTIPTFFALNKWAFPAKDWWIVIAFFMLIALIINGVKALNIFNKWEQKMIQKQLNKK
ncbi:histidine kinase [Flavobacterium sp. CBA20B-1]|uniref:histidine kinase n=1 Tax=unclassified Flavobacterium TaxID=196869 RepID=UPI0022245621|nr:MULTISPECIES: histidine kinase [unclassified Flavobacterium]WCM42865.1 histidine kinase [Flavobacterium sp. CBA20B-1]